jgi:hypothetical protein
MPRPPSILYRVCVDADRCEGGKRTHHDRDDRKAVVVLRCQGTDDTAHVKPLKLHAKSASNC